MAQGRAGNMIRTNSALSENGVVNAVAYTILLLYAYECIHDMLTHHLHDYCFCCMDTECTCINSCHACKHRGRLLTPYVFFLFFMCNHACKYVMMRLQNESMRAHI